MDFLEPCFVPGACAGGQVTGLGQRVQTVYANDAPILVNLDLFAAGATDYRAATRKALVYASGGKIVLRIQTVTRAAVLSQITVYRAFEATAAAYMQGLEIERPKSCPNSLSFYGATDTKTMYWCYASEWFPMVGATWVIK